MGRKMLSREEYERGLNVALVGEANAIHTRDERVKRLARAGVYHDFAGTMSLYDMELALVARRFSAETRQWMKLTIRLFDERKNGFGCAPETWREVRGRGWYATRNGWTSLTEKGRREIPALL